MSDKPKVLTPQQDTFCNEYVKCADGAEAARRAGYAPKSAAHRAWDFLNHCKPVIQRVEELRKALTEENIYTAKKAFAETERGLRMAEETKNSMSYCKLVELRSRLAGLLTEKVDVRAAAGFQIRIIGIDTPEAEVISPNEALQITSGDKPKDGNE